jgi:hypothetical protein
MRYNAASGGIMADCGCEEYRELTRRRFLGATVGGGVASFLGLANPQLLFGALGGKRTADSVILLWMAGGQSHLDTWDPKPGTETGGPFSAIDTAVKGIQLSEHLPRIAKGFKDISLIRSLTSREGSHERATYLMHTGYAPLGSFQHSTIGSVIAKMKDADKGDLPPYISVGGQTWPAGYLGSNYAAFRVGNPNEPTQNIEYHKGVDAKRFQDRLTLLNTFDREFARGRSGADVIEAYAKHYEAAYQLMKSRDVSAFDLSGEPKELREQYGLTFFGQGCLLARRLVQKKVRFVEVNLGGWDTHQNNFETVAKQCKDLDQAVSALVEDLRKKDLLPRTVVLLCSEFGRTPKINTNNGRDHWPRVWSAMLAGGGIAGGRVIGASTPDGSEVADNPVTIGALHATLCRCLDIDPTKVNYAPDGRPIRIVQDATLQPPAELFS